MPSLPNTALPLFDLDRAFASNKAIFGDLRMEAEVGEPGDSGGEQAGSVDDGGPEFPENTAPADMTPEQQVGYWKAMARKHESRASKFGNMTPDELTALREKAAAHDALEHELLSDHEKALEAAKAEARRETASEYTAELVKTKFEAAAAGRLEADRLASILAPLDLNRFLGEDGHVDGTKVSAYVDSIAPAALVPPRKTGPSSLGLGQTAHTPSEPGEQGRAMAKKRFGDRAAI